MLLQLPTAEKIGDFVGKMGLPTDEPGFRMMAKCKVNGPEADPVWTLAKSTFPGDVTWNFAAVCAHMPQSFLSVILALRQCTLSVRSSCSTRVASASSVQTSAPLRLQKRLLHSKLLWCGAGLRISSRHTGLAAHFNRSSKSLVCAWLELPT